MMPQNKTIEGLLGASGNPFFQAGMGLLASRYNPQVNPWLQTMENLTMAKQASDTQADRQRQEQLREQLGQFFQQRGGMPGMPGGGMPAPMAPPGGMAGQMMGQPGMPMPQSSPMTQQQRFQGMHPMHMQYMRNMALRDLVDKGK